MGRDVYESKEESTASDDGQHGLTIAELVCELVYSEKPLADIAGYDDRQMQWVIARKRDEHGKLIRHDPDLPSWVEVDSDGMRIVSSPKPFSIMFQQVKKRQGLSPKEVENAWQEYKQQYPNLGVANRDMGDPYTHRAQTNNIK